MEKSPRQARTRKRRRRLQVASTSSSSIISSAGIAGSFSYYDNLRSSFGEGITDDSEYSPVLQNEKDALIESEEDSSVLRVLPPLSSVSARVNNSNNTNINNSSSSSASSSPYRLIHLPCAFGFSQKVGQERTVLTSLFASAKAALMAQHHFNNRIETIIPNLQSKHLTNRHTGKACDVRMTIDFYDTSRSPRTGAAIVTQKIYPRHFPYQPTAIIGAVRSSVSLPMAIMNSMQQLPQISYASTSTTLSNRDAHPYFARTIPSNDGHAQAAMDFFASRLGTKHVGILYVQDEYGVDYQLALQQAAAKRDIQTVSAAITWDPSSSASSSSSNTTNTFDTLHDSMNKAIDKLLASGYRHFMAIIFSHHLELLIEMGAPRGLLGPGTFWLLGDGISHRHVEQLQYPVDTPMARALQGLGILTTGSWSSSRNLERFIDEYHAFDAMEEFPAYFASKTPLATDYVKFEQNYTFQEPSQFPPLVYDSIMGLGIAACQAQEDFFNGQELLDEFLKIDFEGASGTVRMDPTTASRAHDSMPYSVINSVIVSNPSHDSSGMVGVRTFVAAEYHPENYTTANTNGGEEGTRGTTAAVWNHHPQGFTFNFSDFSSIPPPSLPPLQEEYNMISHASFVVGSLCACLVVASAIGFGIWTWWNRESHVVKASQPGFLLAICLGCIFMGLSAITLGADSPRQSNEWANFSCMATIWMFSVGFSLAFSALFAKTWRINKILGGENQFRRVVVTPKDVILPGTFIVLGNIGVLLFWQLYDPLQFVRTYDGSMSVDAYGRPNESCGKCMGKGNSGMYFWLSLLVINGIAIVAANVQAYRARHITTEFSESSYTAIAMAISLQAMVIALPIFLFETTVYTSYVAKITLILMTDGSILFLMFIPKIFSWLKYLKETKKREQERAKRQSRRLTAFRLSRPCNIHQPGRGGGGRGGRQPTADMGKDVEECVGAGAGADMVDDTNGGGDDDDNNNNDGRIIQRSFEEMLLVESGVQVIENRRILLHVSDDCHHNTNRPRSDLSSGVRVISNNPSFSMNRSDGGSSSNDRPESPNHLSLSHGSCPDGMVSTKTIINAGLNQQEQEQQHSLSMDEEGIEVVVQGCNMSTAKTCFISAQSQEEKTESHSMSDENATSK